MNIFDAIREIQLSLAEAHAEISRLRWAHDHSMLHGPVCDVDAKKQLCRMVVGENEDGEEVKSPWIPYSQIAGTRKVHSVPSKGQQMTMLSPNGDYLQAVAVPFTWSNNNLSPSENEDEDVDTRGKTRTTQKDASFKREVDGVTENLSKQSRSLTIHKDEQNPTTVDDAHPWQGNKADALHSLEATKDGGFAFKVKIGSDQHEIKFHPDNGITHSVNGGQHEITVHPQNGIKHKSSQRVTIEAPQIAHSGDLMVSGSIHSARTIQSVIGLIGPQIAGVPGTPPNATTW
jgi:phage baseplate assembly protein gpV